MAVVSASTWLVPPLLSERQSLSLGSGFETRVIKAARGSLPEGGNVEGVPIHAIEGAASALQALACDVQAPEAVMHDDLILGSQLAFTINDVLSKGEADALVAITERLGYTAAAPTIKTPPGVRRNMALLWYDDGSLAELLFRRICHILPQVLDGKKLVGLSHGFYHFRYAQGDVFRKHFDGDWPGYQIADDGWSIKEIERTRSKLSMTLYLNGGEDGLIGGSTRLFRKDDGFVDVVPRKGAALFFRHGDEPETVWHEGTEVYGDVPKYVARINILYER